MPAGAPVVLVDLDDTVYERAAGQPLPGAPACLRELARDHLIVYLTARPTSAKIPGVTHNRGDSEEFLRTHGFPDGPLFTSSLWEWLVHGEGGGKVVSLERLREFGIERVALAVGDRPHDLRAYLDNGHVHVERAVIILIEGPEHPDPDRRELPPSTVARTIVGAGHAWARILSAYRSGWLDGSRSWTVSQPLRSAAPPP